MKKIVLMFFVLFAYISLPFSSIKAQEELTPIRIADIRSEFWLPVYVAQELGYYNEFGLDAEIVLFNDGPVAFQSMNAGDAEFTLMSSEPILVAYDQGQQSDIIMATLKRKPFMVLGSSEITTVEELEGKVVGAGSPGSAPYAFVSAVLKKHNLDPQNDIELVNMDYPAMITAISNGSIDGAFADSTRKSQDAFDSVNILVDTSDLDTHVDFYGTDVYESSIIVTSKEFNENNPETVQAFVDAVLKAMEWQSTASDKEIAELISPYFEGLDMVPIIADTRELLSEDGKISEEGYAAMEKFVLDEGLIQNSIPYDDIIDMSYLEE